MREIFADLHVHIGRSESGKPIKITAAKSLNFANIAKECADRKGIQIVGIIDCASPYVIEDIENFLEELGIGFTFIKSEYPIKLGNRYNYIDLLLYNIKYRCYVVVELKITELKKEHTGQIMTYMNYIDKNIKTIEENDTVGIIICKQDNEYVIKYCSDNGIIAREYELLWYNAAEI